MNRASYDANGALQPDTPIAPEASIGDIVTLRGGIAGHKLRQARHGDRVAIRAIRSEMPST